ncbi:hypothetical protein [Nocardia jejuensis]|uniref:hypothetical protein n=1 Tax=Nocardia jejuensis TaxID=328049 RepID=UPI0008301C8B|nr:hypothetical protein [Nocardia jejuensis]
MKQYSKVAATAFLAVAATGIAAGTGYAVPVEPAPAVQDQKPLNQVQGAQQGVDYTVKLAEVGNGIITQVTGGQFGLDAAGKNVVLTNEAGVVVTKVALAGEISGKPVELRADVANDGRQLTLTPVTDTLITAKEIGSQEWFFSELQHAALGGVIGAIIGAFFFGVGLPFGALIGLLIAGGQPLIDSGSAYFQGQP